jgi:hypothetical protein
MTRIVTYSRVKAIDVRRADQAGSLPTESTLVDLERNL